MVFNVNHFRIEVLPDVHFFTLDVLVKVLKGNKNEISSSKHFHHSFERKLLEKTLKAHTFFANLSGL